MDQAESASLIKAAAYVRMSTEHQQYSVDNQMDLIKEYAERRNMKIITVYSDEGKSGLNIRGRDSLSKMIADVDGKQVDFQCILVYDVSRWGRFQDSDESAYYEFICRRAGVTVHYCAEQFENDGSAAATIIKSVKRTMAGEYSRELSSKVFQGACRLIQLGYKQGGTAGYGLRRMLVDQAGQQKGTLKLGEQKSIQTDRIILVPGPDEEVETVRWMYRALVEEKKTETEISADLNARGILTDYQRPWRRATVHEVLTNEKYIGNNLYHRTSCKLKKKYVRNPPKMWIRADGAFQGIVDRAIFAAAQKIILDRSQAYSDEEMLESLRSILITHGRISGFLINETEKSPSSSAYRHRFGSLVRAYQLIGYDPQIDFRFIEVNRQVRRLHPELMAEVIEKMRFLGAEPMIDKETDLIRLNDEITVSVVLCRCHKTDSGAARWTVRLDEGLKPDITIAARLDTSNQAILDYYVLPALDMTWGRLRLAEENGVYLDAYQFPNLDRFFQMASRCSVEETA